MRNLVNDLKPHLVAWFLGICIGTLCTVWGGGVSMDTDILSMLSSVTLFVPFLFAFAQFDRQAEKWQLLVLTYGTSVLYGMMGAILLENTTGSIIKWPVYAFSYGICLAVWTSGHQSRDFRTEIASEYGEFPKGVRRLIGFLVYNREHKLADGFVRGLIQLEQNRLIREWAEFSVRVHAVEDGVENREEIQLLLDQARSEIECWFDEYDEDEEETPRRKKRRKRRLHR